MSGVFLSHLQIQPKKITSNFCIDPVYTVLSVCRLPFLPRLSGSAFLQSISYFANKSFIRQVAFFISAAGFIPSDRKDRIQKLFRYVLLRHFFQLKLFSFCYKRNYIRVCPETGSGHLQVVGNDHIQIFLF